MDHIQEGEGPEWGNYSRISGHLTMAGSKPDVPMLICRRLDASILKGSSLALLELGPGRRIFLA